MKLPLIIALCLCFSGLGVAEDKAMTLTPDWEFVADTVMGGVSQGSITKDVIAGQPATRLTGKVSLDNNGGFVQMAFDLRPGGGAFDASEFTGIEFDAFGNNERYDLRLRTTALTRPWQSFRTDFVASATWTKVQIPFSDFAPHKTDAAFNAADLRRIGILAYGREMKADIAIAAIRFYH